MNTETKTPTRPLIAAEITRALEAATRPLTLSDLYDMCESAETKEDLARVLSYLKSDGRIENGDEVQPGEPGGMSGKGARAVASYRLASAVAIEAQPLGAWADQADADLTGTNIGDAGIQSFIASRHEPAIRQGKSADVIEALRDAYPDVAEAFDRLDDASDSRNGDEFSSGPLPPASAWREDEPRAFSPDPAMLADMRRERCDAGMSEDRAALLIHGAEELLIAIARERLVGDRVWDLAHAQYQALMESL